VPPCYDAKCLEKRQEQQVLQNETEVHLGLASWFEVKRDRKAGDRINGKDAESVARNVRLEVP